MLITSSGHFARRGPSEPASAICLVCAIPRPTRYRFAAICLKKVNSTKNGAAATGPARSIPPTAGMGDYAQGRTAKQVSSQRGERTRPKMCIESWMFRQRQAIGDHRCASPLRRCLLATPPCISVTVGKNHARSETSPTCASFAGRDPVGKSCAATPVQSQASGLRSSPQSPAAPARRQRPPTGECIRIKVNRDRRFSHVTCPTLAFADR
jgi:hypothetical protein